MVCSGREGKTKLDNRSAKTLYDRTHTVHKMLELRPMAGFLQLAPTHFLSMFPHLFFNFHRIPRKRLCHRLTKNRKPNKTHDIFKSNGCLSPWENKSIGFRTPVFQEPKYYMLVTTKLISRTDHCITYTYHFGSKYGTVIFC